ncbi:uncharacterized protein LOC131315528 [Rhododendron vialii]|uniref:uncharacterized protein LOC131315528 n=1 Tax=Rhododendron vialii TaxID=182163 RepID=UPI00265EE77C|nr:uncharacterized protein LOC131315528 [Rhododendron vialii]
MVGLRNIEELESDEPIEQYSEEELNWLNSSPSQHTYSPLWGPTNFPYFPPSPPYFTPPLPTTTFPPSPPSFPPYPPASPPQPSSFDLIHFQSARFSRFYPQNEQHEDIVRMPAVDLGYFVQHTIHYRGGGVLDVIPSGRLVTINGLELQREDIKESQAQFLAVLMDEKVQSRDDVLDMLAMSQDSNLRFNSATPEYEDMVDQSVLRSVRVRQSQMEYRGGGLEVIGDASTINGVEIQGLSTTPEPSLIFQTTDSKTVWLGRRGQWAVEFHFRWNWLNIGTFKSASLASEWVIRFMGGKDDLFAFPRLFVNENRSEPPPQLALTSQVENRNEDFGLGCSEAVGNDEVEAVENIGTERTGDDCVMADQLNSECLGKKKTKEKNPVGERRNKKTNGVRIAISPEDISQNKRMRSEDAAKHLKVETVGKWSGGRNKKNAISLEDILRCKEMPQKVAAKHLKVGLSTLKRACRGHGIRIWPPCGEHNQSSPNESPTVVDKEQIPQLKSDKLLPSNQVSTTTSTESVTMKARFGKHTIKFQLSWPFGTEELKQQVKKRLELETGTYYINYKDEDNDDILIGCDEDLQDHISRSSIPGINSIEVFLQPK